MEPPATTPLPIEPMNFTAEWEARLFAIVTTLVANNVFEWAEFRTHLVRFNNSLPTDNLDMTLSSDLSMWAHALGDLLHQRGLLPER